MRAENISFFSRRRYPVKGASKQVFRCGHHVLQSFVIRSVWSKLNIFSNILTYLLELYFRCNATAQTPFSTEFKGAQISFKVKGCGSYYLSHNADVVVVGLALSLFHKTTTLVYGVERKREHQLFLLPTNTQSFALKSPPPRRL